jgi:signal transduction histidine kinase
VDFTARILIVDDEKGIRQGCCRVLEPLGYEVVQAETIQAGLACIEETLFDLALIDVMLPDGRGIELLEHIHAHDADTVCIIITGYATVELAVQAIKQGAYDFLAKPFNADVLELTVGQALEKRRLAINSKQTHALEAQLEEAQREKAEFMRMDKFKTQFMWTMAHELRAPLSAAQSLLRTLLQGIGGTLTGDQHELLSRVEVRLCDLQTLVNDLLALAASKNPELELKHEKIDLAALLADVMQEFSPQADEKGVQLNSTLPSNSLFIHSSRDGLKTIFTNLLDNAIKYTPVSGSVSFVVYTQDDGVEIEVSDTGIGIPAESLDQLGEEFFRAPNARHTGLPGTGLGLSIVKQVLERLGGRMTVQSKIGIGTTIKIWIPSGSEASYPA